MKLRLRILSCLTSVVAFAFMAAPSFSAMRGANRPNREPEPDYAAMYGCGQGIQLPDDPPLHEAVDELDLEEVRRLVLEENKDVNELNYVQQTPLDVACFQKEWEAAGTDDEIILDQIIAFLIERGGQRRQNNIRVINTRPPSQMWFTFNQHQ